MRSFTICSLSLVLLTGLTTVAQAQPPHSAKTLEGHKGFIHALSFSPDSNTLASAGYEDQTMGL